MSNYYNPVKIVQTKNWLEELHFRVKDLTIKNPIIITSSGNKKRLKLDSIFRPDSIFSSGGNNPTFSDCENAIKFCQKNNFSGVIAIGGGSAMDLAKVVMAYLSLGKTDIYELISYKKDFPKKVPSIFLPTTHGTASEVTMWGTVWNMKEKKKFSISHPNLYPDIAILDGSLTLTLPLDISIVTIMDALSHSFESIWNKRANPISTNHAINAICSIMDMVEDFKKNTDDVNIRNNLLLASATAGLAFSNTKTAAAHSISYPLTIHYGIPHGVASSITLIPLLKINKPFIREPLGEIYKILEISYDELVNISKNINSSDIIPYRLELWKYRKVNYPN